MKKFLFLLGLLFLSQLGEAADKRLFTLYNRYSGQIKQYNVNNDGKIIGGAVKQKYWKQDIAELDVKTVRANNRNQQVLLSSNSKNNIQRIHQVNANSGFGKLLWRHDDDFDHIRSYQVNGKYFFLLSENKKKGNYAIYESERDQPVPGKRVQKSNNWEQWTYHDFIFYDGKTYLVRYNYTNGNLRVNRMDKSGKIGKSVKNTTIDKGWTSLVFYTINKKKYLMRINRNTGRTVVHSVGKDLSFKKKIDDKSLSKGWHLAEYSYLDNDGLMFFVNRRTDRLVVRKIKNNGRLGKVTLNTMTPGKGWTALDVMRGEKKKKSMNAGTSYAQRAKKKARAKKRASLIVFYNDDKPMWQIAQRAQVQEEYAIKNYDKSILLSNKKYTSKPKPSKKDNATEANFFKYLTELADDGYYVDIFIITHGSRTSIILEESENKYNPEYDGYLHPWELTARLNPIYGQGKFPIRMVFMLNCWGGSSFNQAFLDVGAKTVAGSRYTNFLCMRYTPFAKAWQDGKNFEDAIAISHSEDEFTKGLIVADSGIKPWEWNSGCTPPNNVIADKGYCPRKYFKERWSIWNGEWLYDLTGGGNVEFSSEFFIEGDKKMTKYKKPKW